MLLTGTSKKILYKRKELITSERCVEMDIPWQLCQTICPLLSQRFLLTSAKAQPSGVGFKCFTVFKVNTKQLLGTTSNMTEIPYFLNVKIDGGGGFGPGVCKDSYILYQVVE